MTPFPNQECVNSCTTTSTKVRSPARRVGVRNERHAFSYNFSTNMRQYFAAERGAYHASVREGRRKYEKIVYTKPVWRDHVLFGGQKSETLSHRLQTRMRDTYLPVSSLNSQYAASISSGSAHTPHVQSLSSILGNGRYRTFPQAIAIKYDGIGTGCILLNEMGIHGGSM